MFGRGDAGGIVNRITKLPTATPIREIEIQYGNFDRKRIAADFGLANADGTLMFRLVTSALDTDTQVTVSQYQWRPCRDQAFLYRTIADMAPHATGQPLLFLAIS